MGKTLVMVLHDLNSALTYSDRICLMDKGRIILYASSEKIVESRELERVFHVNCCPVAMDGESTQYVFTLKKIKLNKQTASGLSVQDVILSTA